VLADSVHPVKHAVFTCAAVLAFVRLIATTARARIEVAARNAGRPLEYPAFGARLRAVVGLR
jgi:hypothetical protein